METMERFPDLVCVFRFIPDKRLYAHVRLFHGWNGMVSAVLAHFILKEKLKRMGMLGCVLCIAGSTVIVLHAPEEQTPTSVDEIWDLATQPAFLLYTASAVAVSLVLMLHCSPQHGQTNILIYLGICSIIGSLTVMSIKAIGIAIKLTLEGINQARYFQTWVFSMVAVTCVVVQLNYLNKEGNSIGGFGTDDPYNNDSSSAIGDNLEEDSASNIVTPFKRSAKETLDVITPQ